jgi:O-succinylbenzoate synthase
MPFTNSANKMEIRFAFRRYCLPFRAPVRTAQGAWPRREGLYVRIERQDGTVGYGEASPIPFFGAESLGEDEAFCRKQEGVFSGDLLQGIPQRMSALRHALEGALGTLADTPRHASLPVAALLPAGRSALTEAPAKAEAGFRSFKWKVGVGAAEDEMAMLDDLVASLPESSRIRLDANGAWDSRTAQRWLQHCSERPVEFVEQPISPESRGSDDVLRGLSADFPVPLALDESIRGDGDIERWLDAGWTGYFVVKPALLGDGRGILSRLSKAGARVVFSSSLETGIGAKAALGMAFAWPGKAPALGFGVWPLFEDPRFDGPATAPFIRAEDISALDEEVLWNAAT